MVLCLYFYIRLLIIFIFPTMEYFTKFFYLRAEFLVIALGVLVQPLRVMQQLLDLPHLPLAAPQLALQLLHLPP